MDGCPVEHGHLLLQQWTVPGRLVAAGLPGGLPGHSGVSKANLSRQGVFQFQIANTTVNFFASMLPNITSMEEQREELASSFALNVGVFAFGFVIWAFGPKVVEYCAFRLRLLRRRGSEAPEDTTTMAAQEGTDSDEAEPPYADMNAEVPKKNYFSYLLVCMYACLTLSLINWCVLLPHGLVGKVLIGGWSLLMVLNQVSYLEVHLLALLDGAVILFFTELYRRLIVVPEGDEAWERMRRTVWMQGLPTHDSMRWWKQFKLNRVELARVKDDLAVSLEDFLARRDPPEPPEAAAGSAPPFASASGPRPLPPPPKSGALADAEPEALATVPPPPARPPPVDLRSTDWRCHLDAQGNPYYTNASIGTTQWEMPQELRQGDVTVSSSVVEEVCVPLVVDELHRVQGDLQQSKEYLAAYQEKQDEVLVELRGGSRSLWHWAVLQPSEWWYEYRIAALKPRIAALEGQLEAMQHENKCIAGSAFVTFRDSKYRNELLQVEDESTYFLFRSYAFFSFGRPPFASVTLTCTRAPHPSDVHWENLHITWGRRQLVFWSLVLLLLFIMVAVVTVLRISEFVVPMIQIVHDEVLELEQWYVWQNYVPKVFKNLVASLDNERVWKSILEQLPTMVLLYINSVVVPALITVIAACERSLKHSHEELRRMFVNFLFLFVNTVLVPFCGVASMNEVLSLVLKALRTQPSEASLHGIIFASPGTFSLKYLMNAIFLSNVSQLLQLPQKVSRFLCLKFLVVTERDAVSYRRSWPFHWGYWYAFTLSVFALSVNMSIHCPSTLPVAALFFFMKYQVDKYNLDRGVFSCGTDLEGSLAVRVVFYLRNIVGIWWLAVGLVSCAAQAINPRGNIKPEDRAWLAGGGSVLMLLGVVTVAHSWYWKLKDLYHLRLHGSCEMPLKKDNEPDVFDWVAETLHFSAPLPAAPWVPLHSTTRKKGEEAAGADLGGDAAGGHPRWG